MLVKGFDVGCNVVVCISDYSFPRLPPLLSPSVCLPLSICGVVDCEVVLCFQFLNIFITTFANMTRTFFLFFPLNLDSSFFSLIAEDTNWFPKENMFSFQTATTTMQAWVSDLQALIHFTCTQTHIYAHILSHLWSVCKVRLVCWRPQLTEHTGVLHVLVY